MLFAELSTEQQATAIEKFRDINVDDDNWYTVVYEQWQETLSELGFNDIVINFTGFWSQGDGASFTTDTIDLEKYLTKTKQLTKYKSIRKYIKDKELEVKLTRYPTRYYHENTITINVLVSTEYINGTRKQNLAMEELETDMTEFCRDKSKEIYQDLEEDYNLLTSDEQVKETIINCEFQFEVKDDSVEYI